MQEARGINDHTEEALPADDRPAACRTMAGHAVTAGSDRGNVGIVKGAG
jgi:hypothetical protein